MRYLRITFACVVLLTSGCGGKSESEPILVGHLAPGSRLNASSTEQARRGILLAVEEVNAAGNLISGRRVKVLHPECAADRDAVRAAAVRLITTDNVVALIGGTDPIQAEALAQVAESSKIPLIAPGGTANRPETGFVFHTSISPTARGKLLAHFASKELAAPPAAVLVNNHPSISGHSQTIASTFCRDYRKAGHRVVGEWTFQSPTDLKDALGRLSAERPGLAVLVGSEEDFAEIRMPELSDKTPVLLGVSDTETARLMSNGLKNPVCITTAFVGTEPQAREFVRKYEERFREPPNLHAALAYDSARLLFDAMRKSPEPFGPKLRDTLAEIKQLDSVTGPITLESDGWARRVMYAVRIEPGTTRTVATFGPKSQ